MQTARCPHCGKDIEIVTARDLEVDYGITPNMLQHAREREAFPAPWLEFPNRNIWLKKDIDAYATERTQERVERGVGELNKLLELMSEPERKAVLEKLAGK